MPEEETEPISNYSGREIIQIAVGEEKDAIAFYAAAAETDQAPEVKELFLCLLEEEKRHLLTLEREISLVLREPSFDWEDEGLIASYLTASGKSSAIQEAKGSEFITEHRTTEEILEFAIGLERKSIEFYQTVAAAASETGKRALRRIIEEEGGHIRKLNVVMMGLKP